jgi:hypothetical protein
MVEKFNTWKMETAYSVDTLVPPTLQVFTLRETAKSGLLT